MEFAFENFATSNVTSVKRFPLIWKALGILRENCGVKVDGVTCDSASANRSMYCMHLNMTRVGDINENVDVTYHTLNVDADNERYIYFVGDPPHLTNTAYNFLANSLSWRCARIMWNEKAF